MDAGRFPAWLVELRRHTSGWWTDRVFAGSVEKPTKPRWLSSSIPVLMLALLAGVFFYGRLGCPLLEPEEARYAEIPRQMLEQGRWLEPVLHGEDYYQKPPLLYWLVMLSYQIFGVRDWAARLVPTTASVLVVLLTYGWAKHTAGPRAALAGGVILCLSAKFLYLGGMVGMDSLLCVWVVAALACAHLALAPCGEIPRERLGVSWWLGSAVCCGLGIMTKGPVAAVLVLGPAALWKCVERRCPRVGLVWWACYLGVVASVAGPWYVALALRAPEAAGDFLWLHNVARFLTPFDHEKPAWFYLPGLVLGMLPWTLLLIPLLRYLTRSSRRWARRRPAALGFFLLVLLCCLAFFSLSGCKRPAYILPALPALALVLGTCAARALIWNRRVKLIGGASAAMTLAALAGANCVLLPEYHRHFGMRELVRRHADFARDLAVACYPRRWDSVSFYLGREVACFGPQQREELLSQTRRRETLLFVKNGSALDELLSAMPETLEWVACGRQGWNVRVGLLRRTRSREDRSQEVMSSGF
jgi:4-amino-4-deoxy-L-arabinose transferase-like glycosyltransferase